MSQRNRAREVIGNVTSEKPLRGKAEVKEFTLNLCGFLQVAEDLISALFSVRMKLLLVVAAVLAVASCASYSLEDLEFHAWKLKFGEFL